jgi:uncharacterized protein (DUF4415 family)
MSHTIHGKSVRTFLRPSLEEDVQINAGIAADINTYAPTAEELNRLRPYRGRPVLAAEEKKVRISIRIEPSVSNYFKATGKGWQTRMNQALKEYIANH